MTRSFLQGLKGFSCVSTTTNSTLHHTSGIHLLILTCSMAKHLCLHVLHAVSRQHLTWCLVCGNRHLYPDDKRIVAEIELRTKCGQLARVKSLHPYAGPLSPKLMQPSMPSFSRPSFINTGEDVTPSTEYVKLPMPLCSKRQHSAAAYNHRWQQLLGLQIHFTVYLSLQHGIILSIVLHHR